MTALTALPARSHTTAYEPGALEILLTLTAGTLFGGLYRDYVNRLGLRGHERVLDFGSGSGNPACFIAPILQRGGGRLTGVDVSRRWIEVAQRRLARYPNAGFRLGDIATLDLPDGGYDVVFIHFVLHDIPATDRARIIAALARKLALLGALFIREPLRFIAPDEVRALLEDNGLREASTATTAIPTQGRVYEGVFRRSAGR